MTKDLYTCLIENQDIDKAFVQIYWARAEHLGCAIELVMDAARANGLNNPLSRECDPYDISLLQGDIEPSSDSEVFWSKTRYSFPPEQVFDLPIGIIGSCIEGEHDIEEISRGFTIETDEAGLTSIVVNVESNELLDLYSKLLNAFPDYKVFWYVLHDHWEGGETDLFLVNEDFNTSTIILNHLGETSYDSVLNGFVTLTAYLEKGASNISISEHKQIVITTRSASVAEKLSMLVETSGYPKAEQIVSIEYGIHHWHYRMSKSKTKKQLIKSLKESGFSDWDPKSKN